MKATIVGGGVIGGGWAARFLLNGWDVAVYDPDPEAERKLNEVLANARASLPALYDIVLPAEGTLRLHSDLGSALADSDWVQESVPERLELKHRVLAQIGQHAPQSAVIASSTSGFKPSQLNADGARAIVAHPFNPVYLLPLVELVGDHDHCARAADLLRDIGMFPLTLRKEIDAHIADRLLEAVWRESLWLVKDGVASTEEIDDAIRMGFGLRWAQMGLFETYRVAGGEAGMRHFMQQFGPALEWPWTKLMDVPEFTDELVDQIAGQSDAQSGHLSIRQLERLRDENLVGILRALRASQAYDGSAAGRVINRHQSQLSLPENSELPGDSALPITICRHVPPSWTDYNGHMNEAHYGELGSFATDQFMKLIGANEDYVAAGLSFFTVETHVRFLDEMKAGEQLTVRTQVIGAQGKKMHLFHRIYKADGQLSATVETLLLHMNLKTRRSCPPQRLVDDALQHWANQHQHLPRPEGVGRHVGQPTHTAKI
ncbi:carnitine 3-dehydrogenase [Gammaproteobacteria bacterium]|nr:carnitine 3-dehydrogenase [Gammaproteobacteria bacterium]